MDVRCSEYKQFSLPLSLILLCSMFYDFTSHPLSVSVCCVYVGDGGDQVLLQHHGIVLHWHNVTTLQVLSRDLLRGRAAEWGGRVMELQTIITNYNVQRTGGLAGRCTVATSQVNLHRFRFRVVEVIFTE